MDTVSGYAALHLRVTTLMDGVGLVPVVMGLFGIAEILLNLEQKIKREIYKTRVKGLLPTLQDWVQVSGP